MELSYFTGMLPYILDDGWFAGAISGAHNLTGLALGHNSVTRLKI